MSNLHGKAPVGLDDRRMSRMKTNATKFLVRESNLFRRTIHFLRVVVPISGCKEVLKGFHDDISHWDLKTARQFATEGYW